MSDSQSTSLTPSGSTAHGIPFAAFANTPAQTHAQLPVKRLPSSRDVVKCCDFTVWRWRHCLAAAASSPPGSPTCSRIGSPVVNQLGRAAMHPLCGSPQGLVQAACAVCPPCVATILQPHLQDSASASPTRTPPPRDTTPPPRDRPCHGCVWWVHPVRGSRRGTHLEPIRRPSPTGNLTAEVLLDVGGRLFGAHTWRQSDP